MLGSDIIKTGAKILMVEDVEVLKALIQGRLVLKTTPS